MSSIIEIIKKEPDLKDAASHIAVLENRLEKCMKNISTLKSVKADNIALMEIESHIKKIINSLLPSLIKNYTNVSIEYRNTATVKEEFSHNIKTSLTMKDIFLRNIAKLEEESILFDKKIDEMKSKNFMYQSRIIDDNYGVQPQILLEGDEPLEKIQIKNEFNLANFLKERKVEISQKNIVEHISPFKADFNFQKTPTLHYGEKPYSEKYKTEKLSPELKSPVIENPQVDNVTNADVSLVEKKSLNFYPILLFVPLLIIGLHVMGHISENKPDNSSRPQTEMIMQVPNFDMKNNIYRLIDIIHRQNPYGYKTTNFNNISDDAKKIRLERHLMLTEVKKLDNSHIDMTLSNMPQAQCALIMHDLKEDQTLTVKNPMKLIGQCSNTPENNTVDIITN